MILGRASSSTFEEACRREWLVSNSQGGYACGTVGGANTRRYHGFLIASRSPPVERMLLVAKIEVSVEYLGQTYPLSANEFAGGAVDPRGFIHIESFTVEHGIPRWRYALADALIEQCIFMAPDAQTSYLTLEVKRASAPLKCALKPLVTHRDHHAHSRGPQPLTMHVSEGVVTLSAAAEPSFHLRLEGSGAGAGAAAGAAGFRPLDEWYWNFLHREEFLRGLDALEDLYAPGVFETPLTRERPVVLSASIEVDAPGRATEVRKLLEARSAERRAALPASAPQWVQVLATATDSFIAERRARPAGASGGGTAGGGGAAGAGGGGGIAGGLTGGARGVAARGAPFATVIAGFPWFADWGRDTMIALPGLATLLGRHDTARSVLRTYAGYLNGGMLPNRFPDEGAPPEYNTADATLWFFRALDAHLEATGDVELARELEPTLMGILQAHHQGTRYGIRVDEADGLLHAGEPGSQLTWMDAKQGDRVFTPRIGKPVEINALWLNALEVTARLTGSLKHAAEQRLCTGWLERSAASFDRFWNAGAGALYDVLDSPDVGGGADASGGGAAGGVAGGGGKPDARIRPNQILAVSLPYSPLTPERQRAVVDTCAHELLTTYGLRSLSARDPEYRGHYRGNAWERDAAYHQGTVWSWLLGPFALAHYRVHGDAGAAQSFLEPIAQHLTDACVGSISEIFEGDAPHEPRGCFAQAWSVAEVLRAWVLLERAKSGETPTRAGATAGRAAGNPGKPAARRASTGAKAKRPGASEGAPSGPKPVSGDAPQRAEEPKRAAPRARTPRAPKS